MARIPDKLLKDVIDFLDECLCDNPAIFERTEVLSYALKLTAEYEEKHEEKK